MLFRSSLFVVVEYLILFFALAFLWHYRCFIFHIRLCDCNFIFMYVYSFKVFFFLFSEKNFSVYCLLTFDFSCSCLRLKICCDGNLQFYCIYKISGHYHLLHIQVKIKNSVMIKCCVLNSIFIYSDVIFLICLIFDSIFYIKSFTKQYKSWVIYLNFILLLNKLINYPLLYYSN